MSIIKKIRNFIFGTKKVLAPGSYPAVTEVLENMLGAKTWQAVQNCTPDRRQLMEEAAIRLRISEDELIKQVADRLDIPVFFRPKPTDIDSLPEGLLIPDLRRAGVLPITADGAVKGVVCVDPAALNLMPFLYAGSNIYLSSWTAILAALDESEQKYRECKQNALIEEKAKKVLIYRKVLGRLAEQARESEAEQITLMSDLNCLSYSFKDKSDREWNGKIDQKIADSLAKFLEESLAEGLENIEAESSKGEILSLDLSAEHGRILLGLPEQILLITSGSSQNMLSHETAKVVQFPRLVKREESSNLKFSFAKGSEPQVLLVDDNPTFAAVLKKFLGRYEIFVEACYSVEAALTRLKLEGKTLPDLIISDLHMPGINGLEFIKLIKEENLWKAIPVVALTSEENSETELSPLGVGADAFVTKTKDPRILCMHVKRLIEKQRAA